MNVIGLKGVFWLGFWTERKAEICVNLGFGNGDEAALAVTWRC